MESNTTIIVAVIVVGGVVIYSLVKTTPPVNTVPNQNQSNNDVPWYQSLISGLTAGAIIGARTHVNNAEDSGTVKKPSSGTPSVRRVSNATLSGVPSNPSGSPTERTI